MEVGLKDYMKTAVFFAVPMGFVYLIMGLIKGSLVKGLISFLLFGGLSGIAFSFLLFLFSKYQSRRFKKIRDELSEEHTIILDGPANHSVHKESVGGWLFLFEDQLVFQSHQINIQNHQLKINLEEVVSIQCYSPSKLSKNGLSIITEDGVDNRFVVTKNELWRKTINDQIKRKINGN